MRWWWPALIWAAALTVMPALGAAAAFAIHWYAVQASDEELVAVAREMDLAGLEPTHEPGVSGAWPLSLDRGGVLMDARADGEVHAPAIESALTAQGWRVTRTGERGGGEDVAAERAGLGVDVRVNRASDGGSTATVYLERGDVSPSLATAVVLGAAAGLVVCVAGGLGLRRWAARR